MSLDFSRALHGFGFHDTLVSHPLLMEYPLPPVYMCCHIYVIAVVMVHFTGYSIWLTRYASSQVRQSFSETKIYGNWEGVVSVTKFLSWESHRKKQR